MNDWQIVREDSCDWTIFAHNEDQIVPNCQLVDYNKFFPFTASNHGQSIPSNYGNFESELFMCNETSLKLFFYQNEQSYCFEGKTLFRSMEWAKKNKRK